MSIAAIGLVAAAVAIGQSTDPAALAQVRAYEKARVELISKLAPTVVCMFTKGSRAGGGSGVIIDAEGYGLTNFHVVAAMLDSFTGEGGLSDHKVYPFDVLGIDPTGDVAMFKLHRPESFAAAPLGDSDALSIGDFALAMGNPFLLAEDYTPTVTLGIISGLHRYQWGMGRALRYTDCIQVDTSINPGNSGGPLFDLAGRLIGINGRVSIEERGRVNVGVGYAISINQIKRFIPALRAGIPTKHATAGFTVMDRSGGVIVNEILEDSPAYKAGLRLGDRVEQFGGRPIRNANQFATILGVYPGGWPVDVVYLRDAATNRVRFRLEDLPFPKAPAPQGGPHAGPKSPDPLKPNKVTKAANRRAVKRAFDSYEKAVGGAGAFDSVRSLEGSGKRVLAAKGEGPGEPIELLETRPAQPGPGGATDPVSFERAIRWSLMSSADDPASLGLKVVGADEVLGRIAAVIEYQGKDSPRFRASFDDENGRLLRIEFRDSVSGKEVRYEYDDYRRTGHWKLPHRRVLYLDDALYAEDSFESLKVSSQVS